jgi:Co/Zn/Cd efflux system component
MLAGLAVTAAWGWWWADPVIALGLAAVAVREGREAWRGDTAPPLSAAGARGESAPPLMQDRLVAGRADAWR